METVVKLGDLHVPFEDKKAVGIAFDFCKDMRPDIIVTDEWHDFYSISRFSKDPNRITSLQKDLDLTESYFAVLRDKCPNSRIIHVESNHMKRLKKFIRNKAPELDCLRALRIDNLIDFKRYDIEYIDFFIYKDVLYKHGNRIHKYSGYTAKNEYEDEGMSGASNHSHRIGLHCRTKRGGVYDWMECGCLCDLHAEYMEGKTADWQHGFGLVLYDNDDYILHPMRMKNYRIIWQDTLRRGR